jgi:hypothetical protein
MSRKPKEHERPIAKEKADRNLNRLLFRRKLLAIFPAYQQFRNEIIVKRPKPRTRLEQIEKDLECLKKKESTEPLSLRSNYDIEYRLLKAFAQTENGSELMGKLELPPFPEFAVEVIPPETTPFSRPGLANKRAPLVPQKTSVQTGRIDFSRNLEDDRYLYLRVDLFKGKRYIQELFSAILNRYHSKANRPPATRGDNLYTEEQMDLMIRAFQLVEKHKGIHEAMWEMYPHTNGKYLYRQDPSEAKDDEGVDIDELDKSYASVQRWHLKIKNFLEEHNLWDFYLSD